MKKRNIYKIDSRRVPGVTTITGSLNKPWMAPWVAKMVTGHVRELFKPGKSYAQEEIDAMLAEAKRAHLMDRDGKGEFGNDVHALIESHIAGQEITLEPGSNMEKVLTNFIKETHGVRWLATEIIVVNRDLFYGGTADAIAEINGPDGKPEIVLIDFKTSTGVYPEHELQLCMYKMARPVESELIPYWDRISEARILHLDREKLTWQTLERDIESHEPFVEPMRIAYDWQKLHIK